MRKIILSFLIFSIAALADPADPWWDTNWRFRVEVNMPTADIGHTGKLNMDFSALGLPGTFDPNSPRLVKQDGVTLLTEVEYNDNIYNDATDGTGDSTGEVKFIVEDAGNIRYYLYYDSVDNGPYVPLTAAQSINGNFEYLGNKWALKERFVQLSTPDNIIFGGVTSSWITDAASGGTQFVWQAPHTASNAYLFGYKNDEENRNRRESVWAERTIVIPATNPGTLTLWANYHGWDNIANDFFYINVGNNNTVQTYGSAATPGTYTQSGWVKYTVDLTPFAGTTVNIQLGVETKNNNNYKTWGELDDVEWSLISPTLSAQETIISATITKTSCIIDDYVNLPVNAKRIPGATVRFAIELLNDGLVDISQAAVTDTVTAEFDTTTIRNIQVQNNACDCLGVASASNNGPLGSADGVNPVIVDYSGILTGATKCGYFEIDVN